MFFPPFNRKLSQSLQLQRNRWGTRSEFASYTENIVIESRNVRKKYNTVNAPRLFVTDDTLLVTYAVKGSWTELSVFQFSVFFIFFIFVNFRKFFRGHFRVEISENKWPVTG
jgi:hypothetical protein